MAKYKAKRQRSTKFHAIAVGSICAVVIVVFLLMGGPQQAATVADPDIGQGDRYVHIVDATWGLNCNSEINRLRSMGQTSIGEGTAQRPLTPVQQNNAVFSATRTCEDRIKCNIIASNDLVEIDPLPSCYKELIVGYRCFSVDRKWTRKVEQGTTLSIDCNAEIDQSKAS